MTKIRYKNGLTNCFLFNFKYIEYVMYHVTTRSNADLTAYNLDLSGINWNTWEEKFFVETLLKGNNS